MTCTKLEKIADYTDAMRFVPLVGDAQLHHTHYRCTVLSKATEVPAREIYVDHMHFHLAQD